MKNTNTAIVSIFAAALAATAARADCQSSGWVTRSMREMAELQYEQEREWAEWQAREAELDESRRELAAMELQRFGDWLADGGRGFCPVQFDMSLPNPYFNTPEMQAFFAQHPEAVRPCDPTQMMVAPTPEMAAAVIRMANECMNGSFGGSIPYAPAPMPYAPAPVPYIPAQMPMFIP